MKLEAGCVYIREDGSVLACTSVDGDGTAVVRMSPVPPVVLPPEQWATGWYGPDGVLIAAEDASPESVTSG